MVIRIEDCGPAATYFKPAELREVERALDAADTQTASEIVVVLASRSGRYERAEDYVGMLTSLAFFGLTWTLGHVLLEAQGTWNSLPPQPLGFLPCFIALVAGFFVGSALAIRFPVLTRPFLLRSVVREELRSRAAGAYFRHREADNEVPGLLIYVSLFERWVWVVGDERVESRVEANAWNNARDGILAGFRSEGAAKALAGAIRRCSEVLSGPFPAKRNDVANSDEARQLRSTG